MSRNAPVIVFTPLRSVTRADSSYSAVRAVQELRVLLGSLYQSVVDRFYSAFADIDIQCCLETQIF